MERTATAIHRAILACVVLALGMANMHVWGAQPERAAALRYFLDEAPPSSVLSELPAGANEARIAKVRVIGIEQTFPPRWMPLRPGDPPPMLPPYRWRALVEVSDPITGASAASGRDQVYFGLTRSRVRYMLPRLSEEEATEYFVASFLDQSGMRVLLGFSVPGEVYDEWYRAVYRRPPPN